jgi:hypothetical protein
MFSHVYKTSAQEVSQNFGAINYHDHEEHVNPWDVNLLMKLQVGTNMSDKEDHEVLGSFSWKTITNKSVTRFSQK